MTHDTPLTEMDASQWELVAEAGQRKSGTRWTELRIYFTPHLDYPFVAETLGRTCFEGESDRCRRREAASITRALAAFDRDSSLTDRITSLAHRWQARHEDRIAGFHQKRASRTAFLGKGFAEALSWLYADVAGPDRQKLLALESDFGIPLRTGQHLLKLDKAGEAMPAQFEAFLRALRWFNRDAWLRQKEKA